MICVFLITEAFIFLKTAFWFIRFGKNRLNLVVPKIPFQNFIKFISASNFWTWWWYLCHAIQCTCKCSNKIVPIDQQIFKKRFDINQLISVSLDFPLTSAASCGEPKRFWLKVELLVWSDKTCSLTKIPSLFSWIRYSFLLMLVRAKTNFYFKYKSDKDQTPDYRRTPSDHQQLNWTKMESLLLLEEPAVPKVRTNEEKSSTRRFITLGILLHLKVNDCLNLTIFRGNVKLLNKRKGWGLVTLGHNSSASTCALKDIIDT